MHSSETTEKPNGSDDAPNESVSATENELVQATDKLISLYWGIERQTVGLPLISIMPLLISLWAMIRYDFFPYIRIFLIIPTNLAIFVRNQFPGKRWRYRPFFLRHPNNTRLWISRGEAPTAPGIFFRPLTKTFMKWHFERRLRLLRREVAVRDGLSHNIRASLLSRLDAALERWKSPRFVAIFTTLVLPVLPYLLNLMQGLGIDLTSNYIRYQVLEYLGIFLFSVIYFLFIPITAFMAKRGLFLGMLPKRICFPGEKEGSGAYLKEREILGSLGLHARESPIDLWIFLPILLLATVNCGFLLYYIGIEFGAYNFIFIIVAIFFSFSLAWTTIAIVAMIRRFRTGRC